MRYDNAEDASVSDDDTDDSDTDTDDRAAFVCVGK